MPLKAKQQKQKRVLRQRPAGHLEVIRTDVAGIDVGAQALFVCAPAGPGMTEVRVFGTTTPQLTEMAEWLQQRKVRSVAMESTGVYWIPPFEVLEGRGFEVRLTDAREVARVPGRKTDMIDCQWIQLLHSYGLLKACFRPTQEIVQLRTIVRGKLALVQERADWLRRMQKCLDQMNVRVHRAVTCLGGVTGMKMVQAIVDGERDPKKLAQLREPGCHKSEAAIAEELTGHWRGDHLFALAQALKMYQALGERIADHEAEILRRMEALPCERAQGVAVPPVQKREKAKSLRRRNQEPVRRALFGMTGIDATAIDGIGVETLEAVISEYGPTLEKFPNEKAFVQHVRLAPANNITGGKPIKKRRVRKNTTRVGDILRMAANTVERTNTAIGAYFRQLARRKDRAVAVFATARRMAQLIYRALRWGQAYVDQGAAAYEERRRETLVRNLARRAAEMGYELMLKTAPPNPA